MKKIVTILIFSLLAINAWADWPIGKKRSILIPTYTYFTSNGFYNANYELEKFKPGEKFVSHLYGLFLGHGVSRRLDVVVNLPYVTQSLNLGGVNQTNAGFGDVMAGFAYHFPNEELKRYFTVKAMAIIPAYKNDKLPYLGYGDQGVQLVANYSFSPSNSSFCILELIHNRYYSNSQGPNQFIYNATWGKSINNVGFFTINLSHLNSYSADKTFTQNFSFNRDFMYGKASFGLGKRVTRVLTANLQLFHTLYGRSSGFGGGGGLFLIARIP
jgi:protein XagA